MRPARARGFYKGTRVAGRRRWRQGPFAREALDGAHELLKYSYVPMRMPEYVNSRSMLAVRPFMRLMTPSLRAICRPTDQNALAFAPGAADIGQPPSRHETRIWRRCRELEPCVLNCCLTLLWRARGTESTVETA